MRRTVVFLTLLALAAPFAASAAMRAPGDGTVAIRSLDGLVTIKARGAIIGRCDECTVVLDERFATSPDINAVVSGATGTDNDDDNAKEVFRGKDLRWKVIGGNFVARVRGVKEGTQAKGVHISLVGKGSVKLQGSGYYVVNDSDIQMVRPEATVFWLNALTAPAP